MIYFKYFLNFYYKTFSMLLPSEGCVCHPYIVLKIIYKKMSNIFNYTFLFFLKRWM